MAGRRHAHTVVHQRNTRFLAMPYKPTNFDRIDPASRPIYGRDGWYRLEESISYDVGFPNSGDRITVPVGFETDYASVPRAFWSIVAPRGAHEAAALIHDYLYKYNLRTRKEADRIYIEGLTVLNVPVWKCQLMHKAVRVWGWVPWRKGLKKKRRAAKSGK